MRDLLAVVRLLCCVKSKACARTPASSLLPGCFTMSSVYNFSFFRSLTGHDPPSVAW